MDRRERRLWKVCAGGMKEVDDAVTLLKRMKTDKPFLKSFACAAVLYVLLVSLVAVADAKAGMVRTAIGFFLFAALIAAITGTWCFFSKKAWRWRRFIATTAALVLG